MEDTIYILTEEDNQFLGAYTSKEEALSAKEKFRDYYQQIKEYHQPALIQIQLGSNMNIPKSIILDFELAFDKEMNLTILHTAILDDSRSDLYKYFKISKVLEDEINEDEVQFKYNRSMGNDDKFAISAICKVNANITESESEIFAKGRELVYNEFKRRFSDLKEMANHVSISIYPRYNFIEDKIDLLDISVDDYFKETYLDEAVVMFREILNNYNELILQHIIWSNTFTEIENNANKNKNADVIQQAREEAEKILNNFTWYKENPSLVTGLKMFMIKGPKMFQLILH